MSNYTFLSKLKRVSWLWVLLTFVASYAQAQVSVSLTRTNPTCAGYTNGSVVATPTGGTSPYTYRWSNGATTSGIYGLTGGTFGVTVTDAVGQTANASAMVTAPAAVTAAVTGLTNCVNRGAVTGIGGGGTAPYTYAWTGGRTGATQNLPAGNYTLTVTDANGCSAVAPFSVAAPLTASILVQGLRCFGDCDASVTAVTTGGASPLTYRWSTGATTGVVGDLPAGTYAVTVTDAAGCTASAMSTIPNPTAINVTTTVNAPSCGGAPNGSATVAATGGAGGFTYNWSNGSTTTTATGLSVGTYTVTVTDANGCKKIMSVIIPSRASFTVAATGTNATCGATNGTATATVTGGTAPFTYAWTGGRTGATISGLGAGTYNVTVTDASGCQNVASVVINAVGNLTVSTTKTDATCGIMNGTAQVTANGTAPYTYLWSNGRTTASINMLGAGTYTVTVTDANRCTAVGSVNITQTNSFTASITAVQALCNSDRGSATAMAMGGTAPYSYLWSNGATTQTIANLGGGAYSVTIADGNGCSATANTSINIPTPISLVRRPTNVVCFGQSTGSINITASGGTNGGYTYRWSNGATTQNISNLAAGTYTVTVTDANGCTLTASSVVSQPASGMTASIAGTNATCGVGGTANATVTGGVAPITYSWSTGATTQAIAGLSAGSYTVTATDANGCTARANVTITQTANTVSASITATQARCNGDRGSANAVGTGGVAPLTYSWSTGATTQAISGLGGGTYTVTITDANGCSATASTFINIPNPISATGTVVNVLCFGQNTGRILITASGGTNGGYTYRWSNGVTTQNVANLEAGTYSVTITDGNGCTGTASFTVTESPRFTAVTTSTNATCGVGGTANVTVTGGVAPITYSWSTGATTQSISGLSAGNYTVTATDANGCTARANVTITQTANTVSASITATQARCNGDRGSANAVGTGGVAPLTYSWSTGATTQSISGLGGGTYTVTITDANGCSATASTFINIPNPVSATGTVVNVLCFGQNTGRISITVTGGSNSGYTYLWSNGATTQNLTGIGAGTYSVTITDRNGCTGTASFTVTQPNVIAATATSVNTTCNLSNGTASVSVSGGTAPFSYSWSNGATTQNIANLAAGAYSVTATDANGCTATARVTIAPSTAVTITPTITNVACNGGNTGSISVVAAGGTAPYRYRWSNGATSDGIINLSIGTYRVTVTDANGCTEAQSYSIVQNASIVLSFTTTNATCGGANGSARVTATGGTSTFSYLWSNGSISRTLSSVSAGTYSITVTDGNSCTVTGSVTIGGTPAIGSVSLTATQPRCNNNEGAVSATILGGTAPFTYAWSNGATTSSIANLSAGTYAVTVTDANSCTGSNSTTLTAPPTLSASLTATNTTCGANNGAINATVSGGTSPYTYTWTGGATTQNLSNLAAGTYVLTVRDAAGCSVQRSVTVGASSAPNVMINAINVVCNGGNNGGAVASVSGGRAPYTYLWSNGSVFNAISNLTAATYGLTVTDADGCQTTGSIAITQPTAININITTTAASCTPTGAASALVTGGSPNYQYAWSNGATTATVNNLAGGTYTLTVTDANGCTKTATATVTANTSPNLSCAVSITTNVSDIGVNDGAIVVTATNGRAPYTYLWSNGATTASLGNLGEGTYTVTVTDGYNCTTTCNVRLAPICDNFTNGGGISGDQTLCAGGNATDIIETAPPTGGSGVIEYMWMRGTVDAAFNTTTYQAIPNSNSPNLTNIGVINQTTYFFRCVRRRGCPFIEGNRVVKTVDMVRDYIAPFNICVNQNVTFEAVETRAGTSYNWTFGGAATPATATSRTPSVRFSAAGTYNVQLFLYRNGCTATLTIPVTVSACATGGGSVLTNFTAKPNGNHAVEVKWNTTNETPQSRYFIERSNDGIDFTTLIGLDGHGNAFNTYAYTDQFPKMGRSYYRLRNVNNRGDVTISEMRQVMMTDDDKTKLIVYPNPATNLTFAEIAGEYTGGGTIEVFNQQGVKVFGQEADTNQARYRIDLSDLPNGVYFARMVLKNGDVKVASFVKSDR